MTVEFRANRLALIPPSPASGKPKLNKWLHYKTPGDAPGGFF